MLELSPPAILPSTPEQIWLVQHITVHECYIFFFLSNNVMTFRSEQSVVEVFWPPNNWKAFVLLLMFLKSKLQQVSGSIINYSIFLQLNWNATWDKVILHTLDLLICGWSGLQCLICKWRVNWMFLKLRAVPTEEYVYQRGQGYSLGSPPGTHPRTS